MTFIEFGKYTHSEFDACSMFQKSWSCLPLFEGHSNPMLVQPCPLHATISLDSLNHMMILWIVVGESPKFLAVVCWETKMLSSCILVNLSPSLCLSDNAPFIPSHDTITCYQLTSSPVWCSVKVVLRSFYLCFKQRPNFFGIGVVYNS